MAANNGITSLNDIKPFKTTWKIQVRIIHSWRQYTNLTGETLEMILADVEGTLIHATVKKYQVNKFHKWIVDGEWRFMENFQLNKSIEKFRATKHVFKMSLTNTTIITRSPSLSNDWYLDLQSFESITTDDGINENILIDVLGQVMNVGTIKTTESNGKIYKRLNVELRDTRYADTMWAACENATNNMVTCLLRLAKINMFNGERSIASAYDMSLLMINSNYPGVLDFVTRLPNDGVSISVIQPKAVEAKAADKKVDYFDRLDRKTISELLVSTEEGMFLIEGTIFNIDMDFGWYYFTCLKCDKTVSLVPKKENDPPRKLKKQRMFSCTVCNENTTKVQPRYKLILAVMDNTAQTKCMLFDNNAEKIVKQTVSEILKGDFDELQDPTNVPDLLKALHGKTFMFAASVSKANINGGNDTYKVSYVEVGCNSDHVDNIEDSEPMFDPSSIVSNDQGHTLETGSTEIEDGFGTSSTTPSSKRRENEVDDLSEQSSSSKKICVPSIIMEIENEANESGFKTPKG